jgi:hypothetical protein
LLACCLSPQLLAEDGNLVFANFRRCFCIVHCTFRISQFAYIRVCFFARTT